jgi:tRNA pseudouridine55 synthase
MYSAVKVKGQRLYKLARKGIEVEREARNVEVYNIQVLDFSLPCLTLEVESGRGVYMRSLAHDLGETLGCGAYVTDLERLQVDGFRAEEGVTLEQLEEACATDPEGWQQYLLPIDWVLRGLKNISVGRQAEQYLRHGQSVSLGQVALRPGYLEQFRAYSTDGRFLALVRFDRAANAWRPVKVFQSDTPSPYASVPPHI